jgi:hypothetical protein
MQLLSCIYYMTSERRQRNWILARHECDAENARNHAAPNANSEAPEHLLFRYFFAIWRDASNVLGQLIITLHLDH